MKLLNPRNVTLVLLLALVSMPLAAQVYKTVDENGNVVYTDQPPADGSPPVKLREISVVEAPIYESAAPAAEEDVAIEEGKEMSLRYLRKNYADFAIVAPQQEESIWHPEDVVNVAWRARYQLQPGMKVIVSVDGQQQASTSEQIVPVSGLERGEHQVTAELKDARNRSIATAEPVTFFVRRPGLYNRRPVVTPHGGN